MKYRIIMKILILLAIGMCCFIDTVKSFGFAQVIGKNTYTLFTCSIEKDSIQEKLRNKDCCKEYELGDFRIIEGQFDVKIRPKDFYALVDTAEISKTDVDFLNIPAELDFYDYCKAVQKTPWVRWIQELEKRVFASEIERLASTMSDSTKESIFLYVTICFDKDGNILSSELEITKMLFDVLVKEQWERMYRESLNQGKKIPIEVMNSIHLTKWTDEYKQSVFEKIMKNLEQVKMGVMTEYRGQLVNYLAPVEERPTSAYCSYRLSRCYEQQFDKEGKARWW